MEKMEKEESKGVSLTKYLSASGVCPRRGAAALVDSGRVAVNGAPALRAAQHVFPGDTVTLDNREIAPVAEKVYIMLHKPRGYVCTLDDPHAPKKAIDLIPPARKIRMVSAGRLDKDSEGMILFSNDGAFVDHLTHPRYQTAKVYEVSLGSSLGTPDIRRLTVEGIRDRGELLKAREVRRIAPGKYRFVLTEGKNREIRRMLEALGKETRRLKRVAVGRLEMGSLPTGRWRRLTEEEVRAALQ